MNAWVCHYFQSGQNETIRTALAVFVAMHVFTYMQPAIGVPCVKYIIWYIKAWFVTIFYQLSQVSSQLSFSSWESLVLYYTLGTVCWAVYTLGCLKYFFYQYIRHTWLNSKVLYFQTLHHNKLTYWKGKFPSAIHVNGSLQFK